MRLAKEKPVAYKDLFALIDMTPWRDRFADSRFSLRQRDTLHRSSDRVTDSPAFNPKKVRS